MHTAIDMDADGKRWRALADFLTKHMAKRQRLLAAIVDEIRQCFDAWLRAVGQSPLMS
jgi:hypothetical protein